MLQNLYGWCFTTAKNPDRLTEPLNANIESIEKKNNHEKFLQEINAKFNTTLQKQKAECEPPQTSEEIQRVQQWLSLKLKHVYEHSLTNEQQKRAFKDFLDLAMLYRSFLLSSDRERVRKEIVRMTFKEDFDLSFYYDEMFYHSQ